MLCFNRVSAGKRSAQLLMPACDRQIGLTKLVTVHPLNMKKGLPSVQGDVFVFDAAIGRRLLLLDGPTLTAKRTAAVTAYAVQKLCLNPKGALLLIGCGVQAAAHLAAFFELFGTRQVFVHSRNKQNVAAFCKLQQQQLQKRYTQTTCLITPAESLREFALSHLDLSQVRSLRDVGNLPANGRNLVIFKSVGHALWDLAAARVAVRLHDAHAGSK